jgi:hypothetical protein
MPAAAGNPLVLLLLVAAAGAARAQDPVLVLRRDWTPSTCSLATVTCREHPDSFSIDGLFLADWATGEALTACAGKPPLALPELEAAGLSLDDVACAFQNYDPDTTSLEPVWRYQWEQFGACTAAGTAADFFRLGLELDQRFPLPQDIASMTSGAQLAAAIQAAFNATPRIVCDPSDGLLRNIQLCFEPGSGAIQNCPWGVQPGCNGPLRVPRTGRVSGGQRVAAWGMAAEVGLHDVPPVAATLFRSSGSAIFGCAVCCKVHETDHTGLSMLPVAACATGTGLPRMPGLLPTIASQRAASGQQPAHPGCGRCPSPRSCCRC